MTRACDVALRAANALFFSGERLRGCALDALSSGGVAVTMQAEASLSGKLEDLVGGLQDILLPGDLAFCPGDAVAVLVEPSGLSARKPKFYWESEYGNWGGKPEHRKDLTEKTLVFLLRDAGILDPALFSSRLLQCGFLRGALIPAELYAPTSLEVRVGVHRQMLSRVVTPPKCQWMFDGRLVGVVEMSSARKRLTAGHFGPDGFTDSVSLDLGAAYERVGVSPASSYGVKRTTRYQLEVVGGEPWTADRIGAALGAASPTARKLLGELFQKEIDDEKGRTALALQARMQALQSRPKVHDETGNFLGLVPTNEQETVVLAERLTSRIAPSFFDEFRILEYTPHAGIDAVVRTKLDPARPVENIQTEFEYALANFFHHRHHPEQVGLIVCWTDGNIAEGEYAYGNALGSGPLKVRVNAMGWRRMLHFSNSIAHLVVLSRFPGLTVVP